MVRRLMFVGALAGVMATPAVGAVTLDACDRAGLRIAIDVGHHRAAPGATSARGVSEFTFNLRLARLLQGRLAPRGFEDRFLIGESGGRISLTDRVRIANDRAAGIFLSVHHDSVQPRYLNAWTFEGRSLRYSDRFAGFSLFVSGENPSFARGRKLAGMIGAKLLASGFTPTLHHAEPIEGENRTLLDAALGVYRWDRLGVVRTTAMPAVLLEAGVIVNRAEEARLSRPDVQRRLVDAVIGGIEQFHCEVPADVSG